LLPNPELALKTINILLNEINRLKKNNFNGKFYFDVRKIANRINIERKGKINAILQFMKKNNIIEYDSLFKKFYVERKDEEKLSRLFNLIVNNLYIVKYYKPLDHIEPPISILKLRKEGDFELLALAYRENVWKPIYTISNNTFKIIFRQFKRTGFSIYNGDKEILNMKRYGITRPLEGYYMNIKIELRRAKGRELKVISKGDGNVLALMRGYGFERAIFLFNDIIREISIPLAVTLFAIKQLDVII